MTMAEPATRRAATVSPWVIVLAGPVLGYGYFWLVYMLAEISCSEHLDLVGTRLLTILICAAAVAIAAATFLFAWRARRLWTSSANGEADEGSDERHNRRFMATTGLMLLGLFSFFVLLVSAPVIGSTLC